jgi:hypothetical protein
MAGGRAGVGGRGWACFLRALVQYRTLPSHCSIPMNGKPDSHALRQLGYRSPVFSVLLRSDRFSWCEVTRSFLLRSNQLKALVAERLVYCREVIN